MRSEHHAPARGDLVRRGRSFLLIWSGRAPCIVAFPVLVQTRALTRADCRIAEADLAVLGLARAVAWIVALRPLRMVGWTPPAVRLGAAPAPMLRRIDSQLRRVDAAERLEARAVPTWA